MPKTRLPYAPEFRRQMIELVRAGRDPDDLSREFEPTSQSIRNWVAQADRSEGRREEKVEATSSAERDELIKLRREVRQLKLERDILSNQDGVRQAGVICGVVEAAIDQAAMVVRSVGTASIVGAMSSAMASVCM